MPIVHGVNGFGATIRGMMPSLMLLLLSACGGDGSDSSVPPTGNGLPPSSTFTPQTISIAPTYESQQLGQSLHLQPGNTVQVDATGTDANGNKGDLSTLVVWNSTAPSVATISDTGVVSAVAVGTSTITATLGSVVGSATLVVSAGNATVSFLHTFGATTPDGVQPTLLIAASDGNFYGTTLAGGVNTCSNGDPCGTVFKVTPAGVESVLYSFGASVSDGYGPGSLIQASDGNFYGTTASGGANGAGTVFKITVSGVETVIYSFGASPSDGATPWSLIQSSDGNFYGTTAAGGENTCLGRPHFCGTAFKLTPAGVETVLYSFGASASDGWEPVSLIEASDGNYYGTNQNGGTNGGGAVFKLTPAGAESILYSFAASPSDAAGPQGPLIQANDGNFYGTTASGGAHGVGTVVKVTPTGAETILYSFGASTSDGIGPSPFLIQASDGNFYGTTVSGGANGCGATATACSGPYGDGTAFEITPAGLETVLYSFGGSPADGSDPNAGMIQGSDGNFYGVTFSLGSTDTGTIFKLVL